MLYGAGFLLSSVHTHSTTISFSTTCFPMVIEVSLSFAPVAPSHISGICALLDAGSWFDLRVHVRVSWKHTPMLATFSAIRQRGPKRTSLTQRPRKSKHRHMFATTKACATPLTHPRKPDTYVLRSGNICLPIPLMLKCPRTLTSSQCPPPSRSWSLSPSR
jgi:hypothetical protein